MEFLRRYGTVTHLYVPMVKRDVVDLAVGADWTPATGDVKVIIDGGTPADIATLPVAISGAALWDFALSTGETTGKKITVQVIDSATKAVEDNTFDLITYGHASAEILTDLSAHVAQSGDAFARLGAPAGASIAADIATRASQASADTIEAQTTAAAIRTALGLAAANVDTQLAAIAAAVSAAAIRAALGMGSANLDAQLAQILAGKIQFTAVAGTLSTTQASTSLTSGYEENAFVGRVVVITSGTSVGQAKRISASSSGGLLTFDAITVAMAADDTGVIV